MPARIVPLYARWTAQRASLPQWCFDVPSLFLLAGTGDVS
jgi:hypothetical protein